MRMLLNEMVIVMIQLKKKKSLRSTRYRSLTQNTKEITVNQSDVLLNLTSQILIYTKTKGLKALLPKHYNN